MLSLVIDIHSADGADVSVHIKLSVLVLVLLMYTNSSIDSIDYPIVRDVAIIKILILSYHD